MNLHELLDYKEGALFWKGTDTRAEYLSRHGNYYVRLPNNSTRSAANIVWEMHGNSPERFLEHIDGNKLNNAIDNLVAKGTKTVPTKKFLTDRFFYEDGNLYYKATRKILGVVSKEGYRRFSMAGRIFSIHQLVWIFFNDNLPPLIDHINGNRLDNRIENLRVCNTLENRSNSSGWRTKALPKGVYRGKSGGYQVRITYRSICKSYGTFNTLEEAAERAKEVYKELHGAFVKTDKD